MKKTLILLGVIVGGIFLFERKRQGLSELSQSLVVNVDNLSIDTTHIFTPKLIVTLELNNPTTQSLTIDKIYGTITNNNNQIATINNNTSILVNPQTTTQLPIQINIDIVSLITDIANGNASATVDINGYVQSGIVQVPFTETLTVPTI